MPRYARINADLTIARIVSGDEDFPIAPKTLSDGGKFWRVVEEDDTPVPTPLQTIKIETIVEPTRVHIKKTLVDLPNAEKIAAIKNEANLRITSRFPSFKQANMIAREGELLRTVLGQMLDTNGNVLPARELTEAEQAELMAINAGWAWIKAIRTRSNELELMDPIPADYAADERWVV